jgi:hypothetical protein
LAILELRQHDALQHKQGLDPLVESKQAQYRAFITAHVAAAMAKATVRQHTDLALLFAYYFAYCFIHVK